MTTHSPLSIAMMIETVGLGGAENVVLQLAQELRNRGHRILGVVPAGESGWLIDRLDDQGFPWETYDLRAAIDPGLPRRMARMLAEQEVDVVHSHEFTTSVYGMPAARMIRRPQVITMHGNEGMTDRLRRRIALRWAFRGSRATVAVSDQTRRHLERTLGLRPGKIQVILNGVPRRTGERDRARRELSIAEGEIFLLSVGSLMERKGHAVLLQALGKLASEGEDTHWKLAIAGTGEERSRLELMTRQLGLDGRVQLLGPRDDVPDLQAAADIFVMPSLWEGLPLAILEAMFAGNAIVASRTSGIPEAIEDRVHGLLTPPGEVSPLAAALRSVMRDQRLRSRLGENALQRAEEAFTIQAMADRYEQLYQGRGPL